MNYRAQKAALTRAIKTGDPEKVRDACREAVAAWEAPDGYWPDDWSAWERALGDAYGWPCPWSLDDFRLVKG